MNVRKWLNLMMVLALLAGFWPASSTRAADPPPSAQTPLIIPPPPQGRITLYKFNDLNANELWDGEEPAIAGWLLRLYRVTETGAELVGELPTGTDGRVTFTTLPAGQYWAWEEGRECWSPTTPADMTAWAGGYYTTITLDKNTEATVFFGNHDTCVVPPQLCVDLEKSGPESLAGPGGQILYHFWVHNCGDAALTTVEVYDPHWGTSPLWSGALPAGESYEFDRPYTLPADFCGEFPNQAWALGRLEDYPEVRDEDSWLVTVTCPAPQPSLAIEKYVSVDNGVTWWEADTPTGPQVEAGSQTVRFRFVVTNNGNVALSNLTLQDTDFELSSCSIPPALAPQATFECTLGPLTALEGQHADTATATGEYAGQTYAAWDSAHYFGFLPPPAPTTLTLLPDAATNQLPLDLSHEFVATVRDQYGAPLSGIPVSFATDFGHFGSLTGPAYLVVPTDANGQATVVIYSDVPGTATIRAWVDDGDSVYEQGELTDAPSIKEWVGDGPTDLVVSKTAVPAWARTYTWALTNVADPLMLELPRSYSRPVTYTITAARSVLQDRYTLVGAISAQNTGPNAAHILKVEDVIEAQIEGVWTAIGQSTISGESWISRGATADWPYTLTFTPVANATAYRNVAYVTLANYLGGEHLFIALQPFTLPALPTAETDACALLTDAAAVPAGFTTTSDYPADGWQPCNSATYQVRMTVTNANVTAGSYTLGNTAILTPTDTALPRTAQAQVQLNVPSLQVSKSAQATLTRSYDWSITKTANPNTVHVYRDGNPGSSEYVIVATRSVSGNSYGVRGTITATNNSGVPVTLSAIQDCVSYNGTDLACQTLTPGGTLEPNATRTWNYQLAFNPVPGITTYLNRAEITIQLTGGGSQTFYAYRTFTLPATPNQEVDRCATVTDALTEIPAGFTADWVWQDTNDQSPWQTCATATNWATVQFYNDTVDDRTYYLTNTVTLTEQDSGRTVKASALITIIGHAYAPSRLLVPAVGPAPEPDLGANANPPAAPLLRAQAIPATQPVQPAPEVNPQPGTPLATNTSSFYHTPDAGVMNPIAAAAEPAGTSGAQEPVVAAEVVAVRQGLNQILITEKPAAPLVALTAASPAPVVPPVALPGALLTLSLTGIAWLLRRRKP